MTRPPTTFPALPASGVSAITTQSMTLMQPLAKRSQIFARFGFAVGVFGIFVHLFADALTVAGIRPFLPLSRWRISLSSIRSDSTIVNTGLFALGVLTLAAVVAGGLAVVLYLVVNQ